MPFYVSDIQTDSNAQTLAARDPKESVRAATIANLASLSGPQTIDGVSVIAGNRVLVKNQDTGSANGIYLCNAGAWTRALDADISEKMTCGCRTYAEEGTVNAKTQWVLVTVNPITLDSTSLVFERDTEAGTGLTRTNNSLALATHASSHGTGGSDVVTAAKVYETGGPTTLTLGAIADGNALKRSGSTIIGYSTGAGTDELVKVSADDSASSYLESKLAAGNGIALSTLNPAGNEQQQIKVSLSAYLVTGTGTVTTTSASDVLLDSMTYTPGAGDFRGSFGTSIKGSANGQTIYISIYVNGVQVASTERQFSLQDLKIVGTIIPIDINFIVTGVLAAQAIEVRWRTTSGTATAYTRSLSLFRVN